MANEDKLWNTGAAEDALMEIELPRMLPPCPVASQISGGMDNRSPPTKKRGRGRRQRGRGTGRGTGRWRTRQHAPPPTRARGADRHPHIITMMADYFAVRGHRIRLTDILNAANKRITDLLMIPEYVAHL